MGTPVCVLAAVTLPEIQGPGAWSGCWVSPRVYDELCQSHVYERKHKSGSFVETRLTASQGGLTETHRVSSRPAGRTRHVPAPHVPAPHVPPSGAALCLRAPRETDSAFCLRPLRTEMRTAFLRPWQGVQCHKTTELGSEKEPRGSTSPVHSQTNKARPG